MLLIPELSFKILGSRGMRRVTRPDGLVSERFTTVKRLMSV